MREIQTMDAKATLSPMIDPAIRGEEFSITRHGRKEVVAISWAACERPSRPV